MEARRIREQLKTKARDASTNQLPTKALPLPHSSPSGRNEETYIMTSLSARIKQA